MATTPAKTATKKAAAPAQRKKPAASSAQTAFLERAQAWLLERPDREVSWPEDLAEVTKLGPVCPTCGSTVHRIREDGHVVFYQRQPGQHWAAGVTVEHRG